MAGSRSTSFVDKLEIRRPPRAFMATVLRRTSDDVSIASRDVVLIGRIDRSTIRTTQINKDQLRLRISTLAHVHLRSYQTGQLGSEHSLRRGRDRRIHLQTSELIYGNPIITVPLPP